MAGHSDPRATRQGFSEQRLRLFAIIRGNAIHHHRVEATYLRLFEAMGKDSA